MSTPEHLKFQEAYFNHHLPQAGPNDRFEGSLDTTVVVKRSPGDVLGKGESLATIHIRQSKASDGKIIGVASVSIETKQPELLRKLGTMFMEAAWRMKHDINEERDRKHEYIMKMAEGLTNEPK